MAGALFTRTQQRVLGLLFTHPDRSFYASEVIARARVGSGAVQRELGRLERAGLISSHRIGSQKHYQANAQSPLFEELRSIVRKTVGVVEPLREALAPLASQIDGAFVFGSVAAGTDTAGSDIDLMIVSDRVAYPDVFHALEKTGVMIARRINPTIYSRQEFDRRVKARNAFITKVLKLPKLWLIASDRDIAA